MPFKSEAQRRWMYATNPTMAKKWEKESAKSGKIFDKVAARKKALMKKAGKR